MLKIYAPELGDWRSLELGLTLTLSTDVLNATECPCDSVAHNRLRNEGPALLYSSAATGSQGAGIQEKVVLRSLVTAT